MSFLYTEISLNIVILMFLLITAAVAVMHKNLLVSVIVLGIFSILMAAQYLVLGAPDVAITEAAVGAGISTILFLIAMYKVGDKEKKCDGNLFVPVVIICLVTTALVYATFQMPNFGDINAPAQQNLAKYFIENSESQTGIPNIVTSILASYRGFDTFGETIVVFTAAISILLLLDRPKKGRKKS